MKTNSFTYSSMMAAYGPSRWRLAFAFYAARVQEKTSIALRNVLIKSSEWRLSGLLLRQSTLSALEPTSISFSSLCDSFAQWDDQWERALSCHVEMSPDAREVSGCSAINACET